MFDTGKLIIVYGSCCDALATTAKQPAKNYYRDAVMAGEPRGKVPSLPEMFQEPSRDICNMTSVS